MPFKLPALPYAEDALQPHVSARTFQFHHGKHHKTYVETLNKLIDGTKYADMALEEIIRATADADKGDEKKIFNNAAQVWNHAFFWHCMSPHGGGEPDGDLLARIKKDFGGLDEFRAKFKEAATGQFGSGWAWLIKENGKLAVIATPNAVTPIAKKGQTPLLTCDVWEHAYYLDYQNERPKFVETFLRQLVHWHMAERALENPDILNFKTMESSMTQKIEGEGSYRATRDYNKGVAKSVATGKSEEKAKEAKKALDGKEGDELKRAEEAGKSRARGEDPAFRKIGNA
ncbi:MAG: superoxide dismutase [Alphaproteobacteria bacterium]